MNNECEKSFTESGRSEDKSGFVEFDAFKNPFFGENLVGTKFRRDVGKRHVEVELEVELEVEVGIRK